MGNSQAKLTRKTFLQLASLAGMAGSLPRWFFCSMEMSSDWPVLGLNQLPDQMRAILRLVPQLEIDGQGFLILHMDQGSSAVRIPLAQTLWNQEHSNPWDRLESNHHWAIVLHWYGDDTGFDRTVEGYLRGFDELRTVTNYITRTSSHFLVGADYPQPGVGNDHDLVTILQTQQPDKDGTPFVASHLRPLDYTAHAERRQYFVRALYELGYRQPSIHSILQDWFDGPTVDANMRSLAIELTGCYFDAPGNIPSSQQIANAIGLIWALMKRYGIRASNILGHHEISLDKSDPGKRFMALIRCLLGAKALTENDPEMNELVFGQHLSSGHEPIQAVIIYLRWVRDYMVLVSQPSQVSAWEEEIGYWYLYDQVVSDEKKLRTISAPQLL
jgi:hypothetical protein